MNTPRQLKQPSTYAGLGLAFSAIPALMTSNYTDPTAWAQIAMALVAIFKNENTSL